MNGLDIGQLKREIVEPALDWIDLSGPAAINLVTGTAIAESGARLVRQLGGGPALSLWQIEPATEQDVWENYLKFRTQLAGKVQGLIPAGPTTRHLVWNMAYAVAICRIKYLRAPDALPAATDAAAMAAFHKRFYNTAGGAADPQVNTPLFAIAIAA
jgi:hypothetical protein